MLFVLVPIRADLLIDISDVLQICCYELGRTYLKLSQALCINIPSIGESTICEAKALFLFCQSKWS